MTDADHGSDAETPADADHGNDAEPPADADVQTDSEQADESAQPSDADFDVDGDDTPRAATVDAPDPESARVAVGRGLRTDAIVTVFGRCTVDYEGRASSVLEAGDRLVVLKPDGTALVHAPDGQTPVNWQPPGSDHEVAVEDGALRLVSRRSNPDERLSVRFQRVAQVSAYAASDPESIALVGTEEDLRQRILDDPGLVEPGFTPLSTERTTSAGPIDIYGEDGDGRSVVVELKRSRVGPDAVSQLRRYVDALERDLHADASIRGVLVAPSVTDRARRLLAEHGFEFVSLDPTTD